MKMEEWKECKLGDILADKGYIRGPFGSALKRGDMKSEGIPVYEQQHAIYQMRDFRFFIDDKKFQEMKRFQVQENDLVISCSGTVGKVTIISKDDPKGIISQALLILRVNPNIILPKYLQYFFISSKGYNSIISRSSGSVQVNIAKRDVIESIPLSLPPVPTQQKIAAILSSLDDKIEMNNKININLEQQAQALFKNWFVDFEPFGGKMPEGWKVGKLSDILCLKKNPIQPGEDTSLPYLPIDLIPIKSLAIREVRPNEEALSSLLRFDENDILIGAMRVYFHRVAIAPFDGITRTTCFVLEPFNPNYFAYAAITCNQDLAIDYAQKTSKGSTMPYAVWEGGLGDFEIPIPDEATAEKFNNIVKPLLEQIKQSYFENKTLQELRESLLPKLMNGEIEV